jgi:hypothetical protein
MMVELVADVVGACINLTAMAAMHATNSRCWNGVIKLILNAIEKKPKYFGLRAEVAQVENQNKEKL